MKKKELIALNLSIVNVQQSIYSLGMILQFPNLVRKIMTPMGSQFNAAENAVKLPFRHIRIVVDYFFTLYLFHIALSTKSIQSSSQGSSKISPQLQSSSQFSKEERDEGRGNGEEKRGWKENCTFSFRHTSTLAAAATAAGCCGVFR